ncbi:MAG: hypothetical protein F4X64_11495 [Chloroflexi bacterium]|nr:hypothetical protein [Chloroflexota bacterium]
MPQTWEKALDSYNYEVRLAEFQDAQMYPGWFKWDTGNGDRARTMEFEKRFRKLAPDHLEAWYEVVFWKLYSSDGAASHRARTVINAIKESGVSAPQLWLLCQRYIDEPNRENFQSFRQNLVTSSAVAVAATFPAFACPEKFPMVDKHVTDWARHNGSHHGNQKPVGTILAEAPDLSGSVTALRDDLMVHRRFVQSWNDWCQFIAELLNQRTNRHWRARDVEMAVFTAQRDGLPLNPLG